MALDPAVLQARINLRICELKALAAWTTVNWRGRAEPAPPPRGPSPPPRDDGARRGVSMPRPVDIVADSSGQWRPLYEDGSLGPPLSLDEMLDLLPHLAPAPAGDDELDGEPGP